MASTNLSVFSDIGSNSRCTSARFTRPTPPPSSVTSPRSRYSRQSRPCAWRRRVALRHVRSGHDTASYVCFRKKEEKQERRRKVIGSRLTIAKCAGSMDNASLKRRPVRYVRSTRLESSRQRASCLSRVLRSLLPLSFFQREGENVFPSAVIRHMVGDSDLRWRDAARFREETFLTRIFSIIQTN